MLLSIALLLLNSLVIAGEVQTQHSPVFIPQHLGKIGLGYENGKFHIEKKGKRIEVKNYDVDPMLRKMNQEQLSKFLAVGSIAVNRMGNKDYTLKAKVRGDGGGPILGQIGYWAFKSVCYGTMAAGTGAVVASTGAGLAPVIGAKAVAIGTNAALAGLGNVGGMGAVGATAVATAITEAGLAGEAAVVVAIAATDVAAKTSCMWGVVGLIEGGALAVDAFLTALPTPVKFNSYRKGIIPLSIKKGIEL